MNKLAPALCLVGSLLALPSLALADDLAPSGDPYIGLYRGVYQSTGRPDVPAEGRVITEGFGLYRVLFQVLPDIDAGTPAMQVELHGNLTGPRVFFHGFSNGTSWTGHTMAHKLVLNRSDPNYHGGFSLEKVIEHSPTEGLEPPQDAVVLLPFTRGEKPDLSAWTNTQWEALDDGSMQAKPGTGLNFTKQAFGDVRIHLEFNSPHMPDKFGQMRGNSGLYIQNRYEVQILESFGVLPSSGDCGGIYGIAAPRVNACYPPGQWQTYDIEFWAPRFDGQGAVQEHARITVRQNGILIHENQVIEHETVGGVPNNPVARDVFMLQDHGDPVRFRNFWVVEATD